MRQFFDSYALENVRNQLQITLRHRNWARLGDEYVVRIPRLSGKNKSRIRLIDGKAEEQQVELIYEQWYDPEARQSRNKKAIIGKITEEFPNVMIPNANYEKYFDMETGELLKPLKDHKTKAKDKQDSDQGSETQPTDRKTQPTNNQTQPTGDKTQPANTQNQPTDSNAQLADSETQPSDTQMIPYDMLEDTEYLKRLTRQSFREMVQAVNGSDQRLDEEKQRKEEEEKRRELFGDLAIASEIKEYESEKHLEEILDRIAPLNSKEEDTMEEADTAEDDALEQAYEDYMKGQERVAVLYHILQGITTAIRNQAKKKPDGIINSYKARTINRILEEIRQQYEGTHYTDLLTLIEEPAQEEQDGRTIQTGMTYSDAEVLLEHYLAIGRYIKTSSTRPTRRLD